MIQNRKKKQNEITPLKKIDCKSQNTVSNYNNVTEWFVDLKREWMLKIIIFSVCFVIFTNPCIVQSFYHYVPFCFNVNSVCYNQMGSLIFACVFSVIVAFLTLK